MASLHANSVPTPKKSFTKINDKKNKKTLVLFSAFASMESEKGTVKMNIPKRFASKAEHDAFYRSPEWIAYRDANAIDPDEEEKANAEKVRRSNLCPHNSDEGC
jgi:hypothetical protein